MRHFLVWSQTKQNKTKQNKTKKNKKKQKQKNKEQKNKEERRFTGRLKINKAINYIFKV